MYKSYLQCCGGTCEAATVEPVEPPGDDPKPLPEPLPNPLPVDPVDPLEPLIPLPNVEALVEPACPPIPPSRLAAPLSFICSMRGSYTNSHSLYFSLPFQTISPESCFILPTPTMGLPPPLNVDAELLPNPELSEEPVVPVDPVEDCPPKDGV